MLAGFALAVLISSRPHPTQPTTHEVYATELAVPATDPVEIVAEDACELALFDVEDASSANAQDVIVAQAPPQLSPSAIPPNHLVPPPTDDLQFIEDPSPVDDLIRQEIADPTPAEMDVWRSELKDLPIDAAREILKLRRAIDFSPPSSLGEFDLPDPAILPPDPLFLPEPAKSLSPMPSSTVSESTQVIATSLRDLRLAHRVLANNLVNSMTPGFKRLELVWQDTAYQSPSAKVYLGSGGALAETRVDVSLGQLEKSASMWDLAVDGPEWFELRSGDDVSLTRNVRMTQEDGVLGMRIGNTFWQFEPPIVIPADCHKLTVHTDGTVDVAETPQSEASISCGRIQLVNVSAESLTPLGQSLYAASQNTVPLSASNTRGVIRQGYRERSNVDFDRELEELQRLESYIQELQQLVDEMGDFGDLTQKPAVSPRHAPQPAAHVESFPPAVAE